MSDMSDLPAELKKMREWFGLSQGKMAVALVTTSAAYRTWEYGTRRPGPRALQTIQAVLTRLQAAPKRELKAHRFPFPEERIPVHCGLPAKYRYRRY